MSPWAPLRASLTERSGSLLFDLSRHGSGRRHGRRKHALVDIATFQSPEKSGLSAAAAMPAAAAITNRVLNSALITDSSGILLLIENIDEIELALGDHRVGIHGQRLAIGGKRPDVVRLQLRPLKICERCPPPVCRRPISRSLWTEDWLFRRLAVGGVLQDRGRLAPRTLLLIRDLGAQGRCA